MTTVVRQLAFPRPQPDDGIAAHIAALGFISTSAYMLWCRRGGFWPSLEKSQEERKVEIELYRRQTRPKSRFESYPERADLIRRIAAGHCDGEWLPDTSAQIRKLFKEIAAVEGARDALLRLLLHVEKQADLLSSQVGIGRGPSYRNQLISAFAELGRHHTGWVRESDEWKSVSKHRSEQFRELATHLFAR